MLWRKIPKNTVSPCLIIDYQTICITSCVDQYVRLSEKLSHAIHLYEHILETRLPVPKGDAPPLTRRENLHAVTDGISDVVASGENGQSSITPDPSSGHLATVSTPNYGYYHTKTPIPHAPPLSSGVPSNPPSESSEISPSRPLADPSLINNYATQTNTYLGPSHHPYYHPSIEERMIPTSQTHYIPPIYPPYPFHGYPTYLGYQSLPYISYPIAASPSQYPPRPTIVNEENLTALNQRTAPRMDASNAAGGTAGTTPASPPPSSSDQPPLIDL